VYEKFEKKLFKDKHLRQEIHYHYDKLDIVCCSEVVCSAVRQWQDMRQKRDGDWRCRETKA